MRTEFAVLTGLTEADLGFDRFNPYHAFARAPVASLAWRLRGRGYRTLCVHPFDRRFFRRDLAMVNLGFDGFLGPEAFVGATASGRYVDDVEVARRIVELIDAEGPNLFVFAITMENHGPWTGTPATPAFDHPELARIAQAAALGQYLDGLRKADRMIARLTAALDRHRPSLLGFYGDHLPSLPAAFDALRFEDNRTDYLIWRSETATPRRRDLAAHELPDALLAALEPAAVS
jgi:phosphoglycerol transferase MdoB-like AlkP superfamily enzyme